MQPPPPQLHIVDTVDHSIEAGTPNIPLENNDKMPVEILDPGNPQINISPGTDIDSGPSGPAVADVQETSTPR